ncbi:RraA family protein [Bacillus sp. ISL-47]|uniref:RraA family protein n=1 Tax=Bacillus sp. ISL-47 TaxID=2819130 RepID=UPI001BEA4527|nr:RraA family protein [Bacillus sp. ISL-47]MBT2689796.1 RraA family protein [Bacillus sp. ISL-47]MBT2709244.1 RraA family protein [Pseudomonas sp. ISL-84]
MGNTGYRVIKDFGRLDQSIIDGYKYISTPVIGDVMGRMRVMNYAIKPVNISGVHMAGRALTVRTHPSDNLLVHKAMDLAQPGDIIVVDASGDTEHAIIGEIMSYYAKTKGVGGFVIDGAIRDRMQIAKLGLPVFAKGSTPRGPYKEGPGEINTVISCGNVPVSPGDVIIGDDDGVVVVPKGEAHVILEKATELSEKEEEILRAIGQGKWDRSWVDKILKEKGIEIEERNEKATI